LHNLEGKSSSQCTAMLPCMVGTHVAKWKMSKLGLPGL
jgi:hypothetical protein